MKINCHNKIINSIEEGEKIKLELEKSCEFLNLRLNETKEEIEFHISEFTEIKNDSDKIVRLNERINSEYKYLNTEIPLFKESFLNVK